jgi:hypothetical protein
MSLAINDSQEEHCEMYGSLCGRPFDGQANDQYRGNRLEMTAKEY